MKLREGWDYRDLYLGLLEELAKQYRISRFKVYTVDELVGIIHRKAGAQMSKLLNPKPTAT